MSSPPDHTVNDLRNPGFDFAAIVEADYRCGTDNDLFRHRKERQNIGVGWAYARFYLVALFMTAPTKTPRRLVLCTLPLALGQSRIRRVRTSIALTPCTTL